MFTVTRFSVVVFEQCERPPDATIFRELDDAMIYADMVARRGASVAVYAVTGEPVFDLWAPPELIERFGDPPPALGVFGGADAHCFAS